MSFETKEYGQVFAKGLIRDSEKHEAFKAQAPKHEMPEADVPIPGKFSLATKGSPCENQSSCGSCWSFGITKAFRSAWMLAGKDPGRLAFNFLLNNCGGVNMWGCNGGDFVAGESFLSKAPWLESQDPYQAQDGGRCLTLEPACGKAKAYKVVGPGNRMPTFKELAEAMSSGPGRYLVVDVAVQGNWGSYGGGIYNGDGSGINHIVNMIGYDMETSVDAHGNALFNSDGMPVNGDGYLIVRNNWGTSWGEGGDMRTRWGRNQIAETAMYFEVDAPLPPTPPTPPTPPVPPTPPAPTPGKLSVIEIILALGVGVAIALGIVSLFRK